MPARRWPLWLLALVGALSVALVTSSALASSHGAIVLGSEKFTVGSDGSGFGTAHPSEIFNGGDPSGRVTKIHWTSWGASVATGSGLNAIFKPHGGYYAQLVTIEMRAYDVGRCTPHGALAYRKLSVRVPSRPGGPLGPWFAWAGASTIC
jgi:hypothetical protein